MQEVPYQKLATWKFADFVFAQPADWLSNTTKLRRVGFQGMVVDTPEMFARQFQMRETHHSMIGVWCVHTGVHACRELSWGSPLEIHSCDPALGRRVHV